MLEAQQFIVFSHAEVVDIERRHSTESNLSIGKVRDENVINSIFCMLVLFNTCLRAEHA